MPDPAPDPMKFFSDTAGWPCKVDNLTDRKCDLATCPDEACEFRGFLEKGTEEDE